MSRTLEHRSRGTSLERAVPVAGVVLGTLLGRAGRVLASGVIYGVLLTVAFLYSRFGGAAHDLPVYTLFVVAMCVAGALAGVATVFVGSRLRSRD